jgi:hypothetical protein
LKILMVDTKKRFPKIMDSLFKFLPRDGFPDLHKLEWDKVNLHGWFTPIIPDEDVDKVIKQSKDFDVVMIHLGDIPRGKAHDIVPQIKAQGPRVIVDSASRISFEAADAVIEFGSYESYEKILKALRKFEKDSN